LDALIVLIDHVRNGLEPVFGWFKDDRVAIGLSIAILAAAALVALWIWSRLRRFSGRIGKITAIIRAFKGRNDFADGFDQVDAAFARHRALEHAWGEFKETLILPLSDNEPIRNTERPSTYFNLALANSAGIGLRLYQALPSLFVGLGLTLTFLGLVAALHFASRGVATNDIAEAQAALRNLLQAATFKFLTSIAGLISSLFLSFVVIRPRIKRLSRSFSDLCDALEKRMVFASQEQIAFEHLREQERQTQQLERFNTDFAVQVAEAIEHRISQQLPQHLAGAMQPLVGEIRALTGNLGQMNQGALANMVKGFHDNLQGTTRRELESLMLALQGLQSSVRRIDDSVGATGQVFSERVEAAASRMHDLVGRVGDLLREHIQVGAGDLRKQLQTASDQLAQRLEAAGTGMADELGEAARATHAILAPVGNQIEGLKETLAGLDQQLQAKHAALDGLLGRIEEATSALQRTAAELRAAGEPVAGAAARLEAAGVSAKETAEAVASTNRDLRRVAEALGHANEQLAGIWSNYEKRFLAVDESLDKVFGELLTAEEAHRERVVEFVQKMDSSFATALKHLGGSVEELAGQVEELGEVMRRRPFPEAAE
jgi:hypothetical protein